MLWYSHLFQNFPQFIVIHTVKGFGIVNKAEIDVFSGTLLLFDDPVEYYSISNGILLSHKKELSNVICDNMDWPREMIILSKVRQRMTNIIWYHLYVQFLRNETNEFIYKIEIDSQR